MVDFKGNPILQILAAAVFFLMGAAMGGMYVKIQYLEGKGGAVGTGGSIAQNPAEQAAPAEPALPSEINIGVKPEDATLGNPNAELTVIEFADFQCPFCGRWHEDVFPELKKDYIDTGKVRFVYKNLAFLGKESEDAANAALCAKEQGKYWEYHEKLYTSQNGENQGAFAIDILKKWGAELGLNAAQFNNCVDSGKYASQVDADTAEANSNGLNSTPSTLVGTKPIIGAQPYATFKTAIEEALAN
jgi:protein-disulfide isomerase